MTSWWRASRPGLAGDLGPRRWTSSPACLKLDLCRGLRLAEAFDRPRRRLLRYRSCLRPLAQLASRGGAKIVTPAPRNGVPCSPSAGEAPSAAPEMAAPSPIANTARGGASDEWPQIDDTHVSSPPRLEGRPVLDTHCVAGSRKERAARVVPHGGSPSVRRRQACGCDGPSQARGGDGET